MELLGVIAGGTAIITAGLLVAIFLITMGLVVKDMVTGY